MRQPPKKKKGESVVHYEKGKNLKNFKDIWLMETMKAEHLRDLIQGTIDARNYLALEHLIRLSPYPIVGIVKYALKQGNIDMIRWLVEYLGATVTEPTIACAENSDIAIYLRDVTARYKSVKRISRNVMSKDMANRCCLKDSASHEYGSCNHDHPCESAALTGESDCNNDMCVLCTNDNCDSEVCNNRFIPAPLMIETFRVNTSSIGVRATQEIQEHQFVIEYVGEIIDDKEFKRRMNPHYTMEIPKKDRKLKSRKRTDSTSDITSGSASDGASDEDAFYIDAARKGNISRFINHHCNSDQANCEVISFKANRHLRMGIFATKTIREGEELLFVYNRKQLTFECNCGDLNCANPAKS